MIKLPKSREELRALLKKSPRLSYAIIGSTCLLVLWLFSSSPVEHTTYASKHKLIKPVLEGVEQAVDPRALWTEILSKQVVDLNSKLDQAMQLQDEQHKEIIIKLQQEIAEVSSRLSQVQKDATAATIRVATEVPAKSKPPANLVHLHQSFHAVERKDPKNYVTSGSFARAVLLTGVVAETGVSAAGEPQPILLRLIDHGIFSKGYKTKQIKEAILIGSCHGNISSERALCRLETISLMNNAGDIVERPVEGWLIGEDGRPGIKGMVVDKASDVARMAILNGILGGLAGFLQNEAKASIYPVSPISGPAKALTGMSSIKAGTASGAGNALQKLADYAIKRAEKMSPVIVVGSGRVIDVVFRKGFQLKDVTPIDNSAVKPVQSIRAGGVQSYNQPPSRERGYNQGIKALDSMQLGKGDY